MLTLLADFSGYFQPFNLFRYISFRTGGATATALLLVMFFGPTIISALRVKQGKGQPIRTDGPQSHLLTKKGTPTMGGLMILAGVVIATVLWANPRSPFVWIVLLVTLGFGAIGFYDDYLKVTKQSHKGFSGRARLLGETAFALLACYAMMVADLWPRGGVDGFGGLVAALQMPLTTATHHAAFLAVPFIKGFVAYLGLAFLIFGPVVIVAAGNSVNLTDGLDGLAIVPVMIAAGTFGLIAYFAGNILYSGYLGINYVQGTGELAVVCGALIGAGLGFLWFNAPPAQIFMGDTGSLALGGLIGTIAVAIKHEVVLVIVGGLFVVEALSVIIQVGYYKRTRKRIFLMAPIHHHFEQKGWSESQIVVRFWIIAFVLALVGLATLKVR